VCEVAWRAGNSSFDVLEGAAGAAVGAAPRRAGNPAMPGGLPFRLAGTSVGCVLGF
jgi:hypothetical protein